LDQLRIDPPHVPEPTFAPRPQLQVPPTPQPRLHDLGPEAVQQAIRGLIDKYRTVTKPFRRLLP
jgi:hypothetical protein